MTDCGCASHGGRGVDFGPLKNRPPNPDYEFTADTINELASLEGKEVAEPDQPETVREAQTRAERDAETLYPSPFIDEPPAWRDFLFTASERPWRFLKGDKDYDR